MTRRRTEQCVFACVLLMVLGVTVFFTWPNYAHAYKLSKEATVLDAKIGHLVDAELEVERRRVDLDRLRAERDRICLGVPDRPDVANLMKHLSVGICRYPK